MFQAFTFNHAFNSYTRVKRHNNEKIKKIKHERNECIKKKQRVWLSHNNEYQTNIKQIIYTLKQTRTDRDFGSEEFQSKASPDRPDGGEGLDPSDICLVASRDKPQTHRHSLRYLSCGLKRQPQTRRHSRVYKVRNHWGRDWGSL